MIDKPRLGVGEIEHWALALRPVRGAPVLDPVVEHDGRAGQAPRGEERPAIAAAAAAAAARVLRPRAVGPQDELGGPVRGVQVDEGDKDVEAVTRQVQVVAEEVPAVAVPGLPLGLAAVEIPEGEHDPAEHQHGVAAEAVAHQAHPGPSASELAEYRLVHAMADVEAPAVPADDLPELLAVHGVGSHAAVDDCQDLADLALDPLVHPAHYVLRQRPPHVADAVLRDGEGVWRPGGGSPGGRGEPGRAGGRLARDGRAGRAETAARTCPGEPLAGRPGGGAPAGGPLGKNNTDRPLRRRRHGRCTLAPEREATGRRRRVAA
mmetsp:Transcript_20161/g.63137  ORF Transcript_20161/g.63137 Transcript_20161/m.63137 type:complete len:320 (-) Transcript_20161:6-965(-)